MFVKKKPVYCCLLLHVSVYVQSTCINEMMIKIYQGTSFLLEISLFVNGTQGAYIMYRDIYVIIYYIKLYSQFIIMQWVFKN